MPKTLQKTFNEYVVENKKGNLSLRGFLNHAGIEDEDGIDYDTPILGLKSFYQLCEDSPYHIVENGYDRFDYDGKK